MNKWLITLLILLVLSGCTDLKRLKKNRQKKKLEKLVESLGVDSSYSQIDTVYSERIDTLKIPSITVDTVMYYQLDTISVVQKDGVRTEIKIMTDSFWLETHVFERDTIYKTKDTTIVKEVIRTINTTPEAFKGNKWKWWMMYIVIAISIFIGILVSVILKR